MLCLLARHSIAGPSNRSGFPGWKEGRRWARWWMVVERLCLQRKVVLTKFNEILSSDLRFRIQRIVVIERQIWIRIPCGILYPKEIHIHYWSHITTHRITNPTLLAIIPHNNQSLQSRSVLISNIDKDLRNIQLKSSSSLISSLLHSLSSFDCYSKKRWYRQQAYSLTSIISYLKPFEKNGIINLQAIKETRWLLD